MVLRPSRSRRKEWHVVQVAFYLQEDCFLAEAEGRCPREAFRRPHSCFRSHFGSDRVGGCKCAGQPQVATGGSLACISSREVNSPDFLARRTDLSRTQS